MTQIKDSKKNKKLLHFVVDYNFSLLKAAIYFLALYMLTHSCTWFAFFAIARVTADLIKFSKKVKKAAINVTIKRNSE